MCDPVPIGEKFPLFGHCQNNWAELAAGLVNYHNVRGKTPPESMKSFLERCHDHNGNFCDKIINSHSTRVCLSNIALKL